MTGTISTEQDQTTEQGLINPALDPTILLFGRDPTPGIVSISVLRTGVARVWRREGDAVHYEEVRFTNWFFLSERELLDGLDAESLEAGVLRDGIPELQSGLGVVTLDGKGPYRWLVLTTRLPEVEAHLLAAARRGGMSAKGLGDLRGSVYLRSPSEQYLTLSGRTYFKGMTFDDLRRMQFDLETTGLDSRKDRIFMISVSDSTGF
jgi:DNA polymerase, archaea type